ncbi:hypothetical protein K492DRAFT_167470 [Lichtheimia hyalospora FSU 10163]|nr:hypothetical protein K492DRAFT_167470 [Lichtheimia hyalospora FSU 10163]
MSAIIAQELMNARNQDDLDRIQHEQTQCLKTCQNTQQQLQAFNDFSKARYQNINKHFETHTAMLKEMKRDMDSVFKKLRKIKHQLELKYPNEMEQVKQRYPPPMIQDDD